MLRDCGLFLVSSLICLLNRRNNMEMDMNIKNKLNVKIIAFGNKEHTTDQKMGVSVLLSLFVNSIEVCNTAYAL